MIEQMLREYKSNLSKLHLIECEMQRIENDIQVLDPSYISAVSYSDTPKSQTNKFNSIVENTVIELEKNQEEVDRLKAELWQLAKDRIILKIKTEYVEALLEGLTEEERVIIQLFFFKGFTWRIVADRYRREFGNYINISTLKKKKRAALNKMEKNLAETKNPV